jgi:hypothetical protein
MKSMLALSLLGMMTLGSVAQAAESWEQAVAAAVGKPGAEMAGGVYRIGLPRTDLAVTLDGVSLKPSFALGS